MFLFYGAKIEVSQTVKQALIIRPQRVLSDDNISARVLYSLVKQFKNHLLTVCQGKISACDFEAHHLKKMTLVEEDLRILKLSKDISIYNELFPVTYLFKNASSQIAVDIGNIHEDKFFPIDNMTIGDGIETAECTDCLCTNVEVSADIVFEIRKELHIILIGAASVLGIVLILVCFLLMLHNVCSNPVDRSGNFIFLLLLILLGMLATSFLYLLVPSSTVCLSRVMAVSGAYTLLLGAVFSVMATSLVAHPGAKCARFLLQMLLFFFIVSVQVSVQMINLTLTILVII